MPRYKILWDDNRWRAAFCETSGRATVVLGANPEVTLLESCRVVPKQKHSGPRQARGS